MTRKFKNTAAIFSGVVTISVFIEALNKLREFIESIGITSIFMWSFYSILIAVVVITFVMDCFDINLFYYLKVRILGPEKAKEEAFNLCALMSDLKQEIKYTEALQEPTPSEQKLKLKKIKELESKLYDVNRKFNQLPRNLNQR